ncbi:MAG: HAD family hydrolase [Chloroflexi bacterium]|nr:HAD family hydrolase [Chloroflexota bacterium]
MRAKAARATARERVVFLLDVDNTLLDNDRITAHLREFIERECGAECRDRYVEILAENSERLGYRDYLGALQHFRVEQPHVLCLPLISSFLIDYPFANRLFPASLDVIDRLNTWGQTVILSDGDVVFQPRKIERSGLREMVDGRVLVYIHKEQELEAVERLYPAERYVFIDDKPRLLAAVKAAWGARVTTVFPRQGHYAHDPKALARYPPADVTVEHIGDLLDYDLSSLLAAARPSHVESALPTASRRSDD